MYTLISKKALNLVCFCCTILFACSCSNKTSEELVPSDAKAVMQITINKETQEALETLTSTFGQSKDIAKAIDTSSPVFAFVTANEYFGLSLSISNADEFEKALKDKTKVEEKNNLRWTEVKGMQIAWNDKYCLMLGPCITSEKAIVRKTMNDIMSDNTDPFVDTQLYEKMTKEGGDICLMSQLDVMPTPYNLIFSFGMPENVQAYNVRLFGHVENLGKELVNFTTHIDGIDSTSEKEYRNACKEAKHISGTFANEAPEGSFFSFHANAKGKTMLSMLRKDKTTKALLMALNTGIDADLMIKSIEGDVSVFIPSISADGTPQYIMKAEKDKTDVLADIDYWKESLKDKKDMSLSKSGNGYLLQAQELNTYFGVNNDKMYFSSSPNLYEQSNCKGTNVLNQKQLNQMKEAYIYMHLDVEALLNQKSFGNDEGGLASIIKKILFGAKWIDFIAKDPKNAQLEIGFDKNK